MSLRDLELGQIVRFYYLWARQAARQEESGRKPRPACVIVKSPGNPMALFLVPITSQSPAKSRIAIGVPEIECRRGGFQPPAWVILDEYNRVEIGAAFDFESTKPTGALSAAFLKRMASVMKKAALQRRLKGVVRR